MNTMCKKVAKKDGKDVQIVNYLSMEKYLQIQ